MKWPASGAYLDAHPTGDQKDFRTQPCLQHSLVRIDLKYFLWSFSLLPLIQEGSWAISKKISLFFQTDLHQNWKDLLMISSCHIMCYKNVKVAAKFRKYRFNRKKNSITLSSQNCPECNKKSVTFKVNINFHLAIIQNKQSCRDNLIFHSKHQLFGI